MTKRLLISLMAISAVQAAFSADCLKNELTVNNFGEITYERAVFNYLKIGAEYHGDISITVSKDSKETVFSTYQPLYSLPFVRAFVMVKRFETSLVPHVYFAYTRKTLSFSGLSFDADICYRADINKHFRISAGIRAINANWYHDSTLSDYYLFTTNIIEHTVIKASYLF